MLYQLAFVLVSMTMQCLFTPQLVDAEHDHAMFVYTSACGRPWSFCHFFQGLDRSPGFLWYFGESKSCGYHIMVSCPVLIDRTLVSFIPLLANVEGAEWIVERHFPM